MQSVPSAGPAGPTLPQRQPQSPPRYQLLQLRPPPQYQQPSQQPASVWATAAAAAAHSPQRQQSQQFAPSPRPPPQLQDPVFRVPGDYWEQQQQPAGGVQNGAVGGVGQSASYPPGGDDGRSYMGPVLPPIAKKKRT